MKICERAKTNASRRRRVELANCLRDNRCAISYPLRPGIFPRNDGSRDTPVSIFKTISQRLYEISRERIFMWNVGCQLRAVELTGRLAISLFLFLFFFVFFLLATCWTGMEIRNGEAKWKMSGILCVKYRCLAFDGLERVIKFYVLFLSFVS